MSDDFIDGYIALKMQEVTKFRAATHPLEYQCTTPADRLRWRWVPPPTRRHRIRLRGWGAAVRSGSDSFLSTKGL